MTRCKKFGCESSEPGPFEWYKFGFLYIFSVEPILLPYIAIFKMTHCQNMYDEFSVFQIVIFFGSVLVCCWETLGSSEQLLIFHREDKYPRIAPW